MSTSAQNVPIPLTFTLAQVNLVLEGLGKLPHERVDQLVIGIRSSAVQTLQKAEQEALAAANPVLTAAEPPPKVE